MKTQKLKKDLDLYLSCAQYERPLITDLKLILKNCNFNDIEFFLKKLGYNPPSLKDVLCETRQILSLMPLLAKKLLSLAGNKNLVFLGRDAEIMYDYFVLHYPKLRHKLRLLPASTALWDYFDSESNPQKVRKFFEYYEVPVNYLANSVLVDTGFVGRIGYRIWRNLSQITGNSIESHKLQTPIYLVCKFVRAGYGTQIEAFANLDEDSICYSFFPREHAQIIYPRSENFAYHLATAMQFSPRYFGHYNRVDRSGRALFANEPLVFDIASPILNQYAKIIYNWSCVNPLGALAVQMEQICLLNI